MKSFFPSVVLSLLLITTAEAGHPEKNAEGFVAVFDGADLSKLKTEGNWQIQEDGSLYLEPREGETGWKRYQDYLWLPDAYGDFVFDFEFKHEAEGNSGFYFRISDDSDPTLHGFEVQIKDSRGLEDEKMGHHDLGGVIKTQGASKNMSKEPGKWNRMTVSMKGNQLTVVLNGELIQDFDLSEKKPEDKVLPAEGLIAIQDHGIPFWVRNLQVKRL